MNKRELIDFVCSNLETTKTGAEETVNTVLRGIQHGIAEDGTVSIAGFGTWGLRERAARTGRNPQTGATIQIKASKVAAFKAGKALKDAVNG